jgi:hypothetical protein
VRILNTIKETPQTNFTDLVVSFESSASWGGYFDRVILDP